MKRHSRYREILRLVNHYLVFFLVAAFAVTCCMTLFIKLLSAELGLELTAENLNVAAKWTFANVVLLSLVFTTVDIVRRKLTVERPVQRIVDATKKIMRGDFSVRIPITKPLYGADQFGEIAECINRMAEELAGIEILRADFIANVSHEIKTPLAVIQSYCMMLADPKLSDAERCEYVGVITTASRNLSGLISNILKLNKLENQQIYPNFTTYNLSEQLCECVLGFEEAWEQKGLEIETDIEEDVYVTSDAEMMTLVWNNLFSNAIKFTNSGGRIGLSLYSDGDWAVVEVADSGCGISQEVGTHMFEKFYQGDTAHATQGNGLGLTLVKRVIDITESEIAVSSEVGQGSVFTVRMRKEPVQ